jgi:hypothetical protein
MRQLDSGSGEQLSWLSSVRGILFVPRGPMFQPRVEHRQPLAHTGGECHLRCLPNRPQSLIDRLEDGIGAPGRPRPPVCHARCRDRGSRGRPPSARRSPGGSSPPTPGPRRPASARGWGRRPAGSGASRLGRAPAGGRGSLPPRSQRCGPSGASARCGGPGGPPGAAGAPSADGAGRPCASAPTGAVASAGHSTRGPAPRAARLSVFATRPGALATSRAWRGCTTTTGRPALARAPVPGPANPPVASRTTRVGWTVRRRSTRPALPDSSLLTCQPSSVGRSATSRGAVETSIPTHTGGSLMAIPPPPPRLVRGGLRRSGPRFGRWSGGPSRPGLTHGRSRPEGRRPVTSRVTVIRGSIFTYSRYRIKRQGAAHGHHQGRSLPIQEREQASNPTRRVRAKCLCAHGRSATHGVYAGSTRLPG